MDVSKTASYLVWSPVIGLLGCALKHLLTPKPIGSVPHNNLTFAVGDFPALLESVKLGIGVGTWISTQSRLHGPIFSLHMGPSLCKVVVTDPHEVEDILTRRVNEFVFSDTQKAVFGGLMPYGMLSLPRDNMWFAHRRALNHSMGEIYLRKCCARISAVSCQLAQLLDLKLTMMPEGTCVDLSEDLQLYTMDSVSAFLFEEPFGGVAAAFKATSHTGIKGMTYDGNAGLACFETPHVPMHDAVRVLFDVMGEAALSPFPNLTYMLCRRRKAWKKAHKIFFDYLDENLMQGRENYANGFDSERNTVPEIAFFAAGRHGSFPDDELKDEMLNLLLAGQDTTSSALQWGLKLLSHYPEVQIKLRYHLEQQGLSIIDGESIPYEQLRTENVPFLEAVILEILRIGQVGLYASRMASCDTQILGHVIPKGTEIVLHIGHAGTQDAIPGSKGEPSKSHARRPGAPKPLWNGDGGSFNPERWLDEGGGFNPNSGLAIPFGTGPRKCFGYKLAILQMKIALVEVTRRYYFEPPSNSELNSWKVRETVNRVPLHNYIVMRRWKEVQS